MTKHWHYLKYVLRHKRYVYEEGRNLGVGHLQLLLHDFQKFMPSEWFPYVETFYGPASRDDGSGNVPWKRYVQSSKERFDEAWLHHQKLGGKHHWQYWVLLEDSGQEKVLPMPDKYRREMLADWRGAGRAIHGTDETAGWYEKTKRGRKLHPETQEWVEEQLGLL